MYCSSCGNELAGSAAFCDRCGAPAAVTQPVAAQAPAPPYPANTYSAPPPYQQAYPPQVPAQPTHQAPPYGAPPAGPPAKKRRGCLVALAVVVLLFLCTCCGVPIALSATGQTIDLGEVAVSDSVLEALGVDQMIEDALETFFPWDSGDGGSDGGAGGSGG